MLKLTRFKALAPLSLMLAGLFSLPALAASTTLSGFNALNVKGPVTVIVKQIKGNRSNSLSGPISIAGKVRKHTLFIRYFGTSNKSTRVIVRLHALRKLFISNNASVRGKFNSSNLIIHSTNSGKTKLTGMIALRLLRANGYGKIDLNWVNSQRVEVYGSGSSLIKLAGRAEQLVTRLHNRSKLDAQYLRAKNVMVQTKNHASAKVLPIIELRAFAADNSNVYYYKRPKYITRRTTQSGNVLQVAWRN